MSTPTELKYTKNHEWFDEKTGKVGITDYAQTELGDIVFVNLPQVGAAMQTGDTLGDLESVKAVSDVFSPVTGTVSEINGALLDAPETINNDPYGAWFAVLSDVTLPADLLDAAAYDAFCESDH